MHTAIAPRPPTGSTDEGVYDTHSRRREIAGVGGLVGAAVIAVALRADVADAWGGLMPAGRLRAVSVALAVGFVAYAVAQEHHLRVLDAQRRSELASVLGACDRLLTRAAAAPAVERLHRSVLVGDVVDALVQEVAAVGPDGVSVELIGLDGRARRAGAVGRTDVGGERWPLVAQRRRIGAVLVHGPIAAGDRAVVDELVRHAASALANARRYEDALAALGELRVHARTRV